MSILGSPLAWNEHTFASMAAMEPITANLLALVKSASGRVLAQLGETCERLGPFDGMVHDRRRVFLVVPKQAGSLAVRLVHVPRPVGEFGHVAADVVTVGVERAALLGGIEDPEVGGCVRAGPRGPLPAVLVGREVTVEEVVHEPRCAAPARRQW